MTRFGGRNTGTNDFKNGRNSEFIILVMFRCFQQDGVISTHIKITQMGRNSDTDLVVSALVI
jgi:hypothetical protein